MASYYPLSQPPSAPPSPQIQSELCSNEPPPHYLDANNSSQMQTEWHNRPYYPPVVNVTPQLLPPLSPPPPYHYQPCSANTIHQLYWIDRHLFHCVVPIAKKMWWLSLFMNQVQWFGLLLEFFLSWVFFWYFHCFYFGFHFSLMIIKISLTLVLTVVVFLEDTNKYESCPVILRKIHYWLYWYCNYVAMVFNF